MGAKVVKVSKNFDGKAREILKITSRNDAIPMKDIPNNSIIPYCGFVEQEIVNENTGEVFNAILLVSEVNEDGIKELYATRSESFKRALYEIIDTLEEQGDNEPFSLQIMKLKSKNGREFITCNLV